MINSYETFLGKSVIDVVRIIQQRPRMWLYPVTLTGLYNVILGFELNTRLVSDPPFYYFTLWVAHKLNESSNRGWCSLILELCDNNEEKAFHKFYELLNEFALIKPEAIHAADLTEDNFELYYSKTHSKPYRLLGYNMDKDKRVYLPAPYHIKVIEYDFACFAYYYDFYFAAGDTKKGKYDWYYDNLDDCKEKIENRYGSLEWFRTDASDINYEELREWLK